MSKRYKELANQAGLPTYNPGGIPTKLERFAKLIVRECMEQVRDEVQYAHDWELADKVTQRVMEHFGLESEE